MADEETKGQKLEKELLMKPANLGEKDAGLLERASEFCEGYKLFLDNKTEREVVDYTIPILREHGYREYVRGTAYKPGEKVYLNNRGKSLIMVTVGKRPVADGMRFGVSLIDSRRLDFNPSRLFEDTDMAYFNTHDYGGIKMFQCTAGSRSTSGPPSPCPSGGW